MEPWRPVHLRGFDYLGPHRYSLRFCTDRRSAFFTSSPIVSLTWSQILRTAPQRAFAVLVYCFMPDHLHLLVEGTEPGSDLRAFVARAKQGSGYWVAKEHGVRLWQRYGYEHVLRSNESTLRVARYILENPVRAGLVRQWEDYPYVGSGLYSRAALIDWIGGESG